MKIIGVLSTAVLSLTLGATALAYPQQEQHEQEEQKDKPAQEKEKKAQPDKPAKQEEKSARQPDKNAKPEEKKAQEQERNSKPEENNARQQEHPAQQAQPAGREQHAAAGRIPDDRYKANFGRDHRFHVSQADYSGRRFQYGGYWFGFVDPWPSNWLYTQDVFVVEIDGVYYLCNASYPGVNLALNVTM